MPTFDDAHPATCRDAALEAALVANPHDVATLAVYADWLTERGDVRGEYIALSIALATADRDRDPDFGPDEADDSDEAIGRRVQMRETFTDHLYGPLVAARRAAILVEELGFPRVLEILVADHEVHEPDLAYVLAAHLADPASVLVHTVVVPRRYHAALARVVADRGAPLALVVDGTPYPALRGELVIEDRGAATAIGVRFPRPAWLGVGRHGAIVRTTLAIPGGDAQRWSAGWASTDEYLEPIIVELRLLPAAAIAADGRLAVAVRIVIDRDEADPLVVWYGGEIALADRGRQVVLAQVAAIAGAPFELPPAGGPVGERGPQLASTAADRVGLAVLPDVGVVELVPPERHLRLVPPVGSPISLARATRHAHAASVSPDGELLALVGRTRLQLAFSVATGAPRIVECELPADVRAVQALASDCVAVVSLTRATLLDDTGAAVWSAEIPPMHDATLAGEHLTILGRTYEGLRLLTFAPPSTQPIESRALLFAPCATVAISIHDRARDRTISLVPLASDRSAIAWRDGEVAIPDQVTYTGALCLLPDGRVLAIGERSVWLVDPETATVALVGDSGSYQRPPLVTRTPAGRYRLWSHGAGPWFLELS